MIPDSLFSSPQSPFFFSSKSLFRPPQSPVFDLSKALFPSSSLLSKSSPILPVLLGVPVRPLPSSSSSHPKTAERHEAVPPFSVGVVCSKMEHDSFTGRSAK